MDIETETDDFRSKDINRLIAVIFTAVFMGVIVTIAILYNTALQEERQRLRDTAQSQARLIGAVATFDKQYSNDYPEGSMEATLSQIREAHSKYIGFGETGEFTLAHEQGDMIVFLLRHRHGDLDIPSPVPMESDLAEPMRLELQGKSGTIIGLDYRGETVLAAYEPVPELNVGIVAKIDMVEIQKPYLLAGFYSGLIALLIAIASAVLSRRVTSTLEQRVIESEQLYRMLVETMNDGLLMKDADGKIIFANKSFSNMLNFPKDKIVGRMITDFMDQENQDIYWKSMKLRNHDNKLVFEIVLLGKNNRKIPVVKSTRVFLDEHGNIIRSIAVITNISDRVEREREQRQAAQRWRSTFDSINDCLCLVDLEGRLERCNQTTLDLLGKSREEVLGELCWEVFYGSPEPPDLCPHNTMLETRQRASQEVEIFDRWYDVVVDPIFDDQGEITGAVHAMYDITEERNARLAVQHQLNRIQSLHEIDQAIISSLDLQLTLNVVLDNIISQLDADAACILLLNPANQLIHSSSRGFYEPEAEKLVRLHLGEGFGGKVGLERQSLYIPDVHQVEVPGEFVPYMDREKIVAYFGVPLIAKGNLQGVLEVFHRSPLDPDNDWLSFLETLAGQTSIAIHNAMLFNDLEKTKVNLELSYMKTLEGWVRALDLRDHETEGHTQRVTELSVELATHMGVADEDLKHFANGALLHDIGKMAIPDSILLKPGPLTDAEWEVMKRHPVYAYDFLSNIEYLQPSLNIPYCHHEKYDGSGYPRGLKGDQIPFSARVFAVVDVWDALLSDRPYRKAWSKEKALAYIKEQSGTHFDPEVVNVFLDMLEKI